MPMCAYKISHGNAIQSELRAFAISFGVIQLKHAWRHSCVFFFLLSMFARVCECMLARVNPHWDAVLGCNGMAATKSKLSIICNHPSVNCNLVCVRTSNELFTLDII